MKKLMYFVLVAILFSGNAVALEINGYKIAPGAKLVDANLKGAKLERANLKGVIK